MKVLHINKFFYIRGGSERYMMNLGELFKKNAHEIAYFSMNHENNADTEWSKYFVDNVDYDRIKNPAKAMTEGFKILYSFEAQKRLSGLLDKFHPDIAHLHNINHQLTSSVIFELKKRQIPVVMTLHDYKIVCPSSIMLNHGKVCELCKNRKFYKCFITGCHKNSFSKSLVATLESYLNHHIMHSYKFIDKFICPSRFIMEKVKGMGMEGEFSFLPIFIDAKSFAPDYTHIDKTKFVYAGRLSHEKGLKCLIGAVKDTEAHLEIIGDGPQKVVLEKIVNENNIHNVKFLGQQESGKVFNIIRRCNAVIVPSVWYENNPNAIHEAFALGKPVIASNIGGIPELVDDGYSGFLSQPGDVQDLRSKIKKLLNNIGLSISMGKNARKIVEKKFNPISHYENLMHIYNTICNTRRNA